jgi:acyl-CoA synthetase (NDP forming)
VRQVGIAAVDTTILAVSDAVVDGAVKSTGINVTEPAKQFVSAAVSEAIRELVE